MVDRIQSLGPKYELMVWSSGRRLVASPEVEKVGSPGEATPTHVLHLGDISVNDVCPAGQVHTPIMDRCTCVLSLIHLVFQVPFLLNLSLQQLSDSLS